jgi:hypothetical protein
VDAGTTEQGASHSEPQGSRKLKEDYVFKNKTYLNGCGSLVPLG